MEDMKYETEEMNEMMGDLYGTNEDMDSDDLDEELAEFEDDLDINA